MHGRYPDFDCLEQADHWDELTRQVVLERVENVPLLGFFTEIEAAALGAFCDVVLAQDAEPRVPVLAFIDRKLAEGRLDGYQYADMPDDRETWRLVARGLDEAAAAHGADSSGAAAPGDAQRWSYAQLAFYSHPWAWNEIGFGGPAYPRGYARVGVGLSEAWEGEEALDIDPVVDVRERGLQ